MDANSPGNCDACWLLILTNEQGFCTTLLGGWILLGTLVSCFTDEAFLFHELWAGVLIALSIAAHARNRALSVALGLLALSIRELSLPFAIVMLIIAYREKHRREAIAWLLGIVAFFLYLTVHATTVSTFFIDADRANATWLQFGGLSFVLTTTKWTLLTFVSPWWIDVFLLPLAFIGLAGSCRHTCGPDHGLIHPGLDDCGSLGQLLLGIDVRPADPTRTASCSPSRGRPAADSRWHQEIVLCKTPFPTFGYPLF